MATQSTLSQDGTTIAFESIGFGPPLVLLHGFAGCRRDWFDKEYVTRLTLLGRRVIAIDGRGHGESGKPKHPSAYADYKRAQDVIAALDCLNIQRTDLHGYSMGGWIAMDTARCFPRRVRSLSVNGTHGFAQSLGGFQESLRDGLNGWVVDLEKQLGRELSRNRKRQILSNNCMALRACVTAPRSNVVPDLQGLGIPTLVFAGEHEEAFFEMKRFAKLLPARFEMLLGKNHMSAFSAANEVCDVLITFLEEIDQGQFSPLIASSYATHKRY